MLALPHITVTGAGPDAILFIGGLGSSRDAWEAVIAELGNEFRSIRFDSRGVGQNTAQVNQLSIDDLVGDALIAIDSLAIDRFFLFGHSLGGFVAQEIARRKPHRVRGLCVSNSFTRLHVQTLTVLGRLRRLPPSRLLELRSCIAALDTDTLDAYLAVFDRIAKHHPSQPRIAVPVMVVNAMRDELHIRLPADEAEACFESFCLHEFDTGHDSINESPTHLAGVLREFMSTIEAPDRAFRLGTKAALGDRPDF